MLFRSGMSASETSTMEISDGSFFPDTGYIYMNYELIKYNTIDRNDTPYPTLNGLTRIAGLRVFLGGSFRTIWGRPDKVSHGEGSGIELVSLTASPNMSHWGSSYIMDGGFDFDRGYSFSYSMAPTTITSAYSAKFGVRLAPSASNGFVGDLGVRELLNRAQLLLQTVDLTVGNTAVTAAVAGTKTQVQPFASTWGNTAIVVQGILNPSNYSEASETWTSLNATTYGSQPSFTQIAKIGRAHV